MKDFIPHQIHLTKPQILRLGKGLGANIKLSQMGSDKGDYVVMLKPQNARKMLTAYKNGRGMRLMLAPDEMEMTERKGSGFFRTLKKTTGIGKKQFIDEAKEIGKEVVHRGSAAVGMAVGAYTGNPAAGVALTAALDRAGTQTIDSIEPSKSKMGVKFNASAGMKSLKKDARLYAVEAVDREVDKLPADQRDIAEKILANKYPDAKSLIFDVVDSRPKKDYGRGLMKGSEEMKERMAKLRAMRGKGVGKKIGNAFKSVGKTMSNKQAIDVYKAIGRHAIEEGIPVATALASMALGDPTGASGAVVGNIASQYASDAYTKKTGRGRPRKLGGGASMSKPFKKALKNNFNGLEVENFANHSPVSDYTVNPKVRVSSSEMTLSPYARLDSPAMNPFIPSYYTQEGGTQTGGKGLYGGGLY